MRTVLLVAKAAGWSLPEDALHQIFVSLAAPAAVKDAWPKEAGGEGVGPRDGGDKGLPVEAEAAGA